MSLIDLLILHNWQSSHEKKKESERQQWESKLCWSIPPNHVWQFSIIHPQQNIAKMLQQSKVANVWHTQFRTVKTLNKTECLTHLKPVLCWSLWNKCWLWNHSCHLHIQQVSVMSSECEPPTSTQPVKLNHTHSFTLSCRLTCLLLQDQQNSMQEFPVMLQVFSTMVLKQVAQWLPFLTNNSRPLNYLVMHNQATNLQDA